MLRPLLLVSFIIYTTRITQYMIFVWKSKSAMFLYPMWPIFDSFLPSWWFSKFNDLTFDVWTFGDFGHKKIRFAASTFAYFVLVDTTFVDSSLAYCIRNLTSMNLVEIKKQLGFWNIKEFLPLVQSLPTTYSTYLNPSQSRKTDYSHSSCAGSFWKKPTGRTVRRTGWGGCPRGRRCRGWSSRHRGPSGRSSCVASRRCSPHSALVYASTLYNKDSWDIFFNRLPRMSQIEENDNSSRAAGTTSMSQDTGQTHFTQTTCCISL